MKEMGSDGDIHGHSQELSLSSSYENAMGALSSLITRRRRGDGSNREIKFDLMFKYLKILDLEVDIAGLKIIHVAGTKGKGSTCTFSEAILRECGFRTGVFTSPHLIDVRERYHIDGLDILEVKFLEYFWDCWNQLKETVTEDLPMPPLFQFLTLLAFKIFISEKVDVAILEVGLGGRLDSTNVIKEPVVCGITSLGMDHMEILGDTLGKIASEKAGIFKPRVPAFTVPQLSEAMDVLQDTASELMIPLEVASPLHPNKLNGLKLGLAGDHQYINAGLAVALCRCWLQSTGHLKELFSNANQDTYLPDAFLRGLSTANLPGRAQIVYDTVVKSCISDIKENSLGDLIFYLDGAHSPESMEVCAQWFSNAVREDKISIKDGKTEEFWRNSGIRNDNKNFDGSNKTSKQILLFNCMEVRDPQFLLPRLFSTCASSGVHFSKALFAPSLSMYHKVDSGASTISSDTSKDLSWQCTLQKTWEKIIRGKDAIPEESSKLDNPECLPSFALLNDDHSPKFNTVGKQFTSSAVIPSLPTTIKWLRDCVKENPSIRIQVLVTGSLHLVGDVLRLLRR
ncbi:DHFS-FPGS homolog C isoform X2 [Tasmannia lanceolata]|uniref:DHFS-FPGS homolog C isoform X2 n=1 Tax=Tasmannia lanceolata TaxID=3420 RepID=UPI0040637E54